MISKKHMYYITKNIAVNCILSLYAFHRLIPIIYRITWTSLFHWVKNRFSWHPLIIRHRLTLLLYIAELKRELENVLISQSTIKLFQSSSNSRIDVLYCTCHQAAVKFCLTSITRSLSEPTVLPEAVESFPVKSNFSLGYEWPNPFIFYCLSLLFSSWVLEKNDDDLFSYCCPNYVGNEMKF